MRMCGSVPKKLHALGDADGYMVRAETRKRFWRTMERIAPDELASLLNIDPALAAIERWAEHYDRCPEAHVALMYGPSMMRNAPDTVPEELNTGHTISPESLGPLYVWPIQHIDSWLIR